MTKSYSTKRSLITSVIALMLCFSMLLGTTFAWFTDSVTSANNIIKSGNLDVAMYWADGKVDPTTTSWTDASTGAIFDYANWEPGYVQVRHIKIANEGSLALKYQLAIAANGEVSELANVIDVYYADPAVKVANRAQLTEDMKLGTLTEVLANLGATGYGELQKDEAHTVTLAFKMQESAGNEYQNLAIGSDFAVKLVATQLTSEEDSFDDQYDKDAEYDYLVATQDELEAAIKSAPVGDEPTVIALGTDIKETLTIAQEPGVKLVIDGNGNSALEGIIVDGKSAAYSDAGLVIKDFVFDANSKIDEEACINLGDGTNGTRYISNLTVENCTFDVAGKVAVKSYQNGDKNITIKGCTVSDKMHSLVQVNNVNNLVVEDCKIFSKNGINANQSPIVTVKGCTADVTGYAVRFGATSGATGVAETYLIENCNLKSACAESDDAVVVLRATTEGATLTLKNTTLTGTRDIINLGNATIVR